MKLTREVKTAILVISGIVLFIYLFNYLKGEDLLSSSRTYYVVYDNVEGLAPSTPVTINGLNVGRVQDISFKEDGSGDLLVKLLIENDFEFSKNSKAQLYDLGIIGGKAIAIVPAFDGAEPAKSGMTLEGTTKDGLTELVNQRLAPLQEKIESVMVNTDSLLNNLNAVFDTETKQSLKRSIVGLEETIGSFKATSNSVNRMLTANQQSLNKTLENAEHISTNLSKMTDSLAAANLKKTIEDLQSTIDNVDQIMASVENGEGSIGKLLKDEKLYDNLEGASKQLEELLQDMKLNPKRYVHFSLFGKKAKRYDAEGNELKDKEN